MALNISFNVTNIDGNSPGDWFDFTNAGNSPKEIIQCVHSLLNTPVGTVYMDRALGVDYSFVDRPLPVAMAMIMSEIPGKIAKYEPRCTLTNVSFSGNPADITSKGKLTCNVKVSIP
jgi:phage baseplate assembly protein W